MGTLVDEIETQLRHGLLEGQFPIWEKLTERRLAEELGVSRTPIREALKRLEREEIVIADPAGGFRPKAPDLNKLRDYYEVRLRLELLSVERAISAGADQPKLERLRSEWGKLAESKEPGEDRADGSFVYRDEAFHVGLAQVGKNEALVTILRDINDRIRLIRVHDFFVPGRIQATVSQHLGIVDAILAGNANTARQRLESHVRESAAVVEDRSMRALARMSQQTGDSLTPLLRERT